MQKVLIISYFYPPANFVGGERTSAWANHLSKNGIYPIIVTRQWNPNQTDLIDKVLKNDYSYEKFETHEVHRLPYRYSWRDRCANYPPLKLFQKAFTLWELIFSNFFIRALPYKNFYSFSKKIIKSDKSIKAVLISGRPFHAFQIGHKLKKKYPNILWVPDYRDEWTSHEHLKNKNRIFRSLNQIENRSELLWTSNADFFIGVSPHWVKNIQNLINVKGEVILNGYNELQKEVELKSSNLILTYAGTLYPSQELDIVIESFLLLLNKSQNLIFRFIGTNILPLEELKIKKQIKGFEKYFKFIPRISQTKLNKYLNESDLLILTGFLGVKGWYPVKLFEYFAAKKAILLCPSDNDVMEAFIHETNSGYVANTTEECTLILEDCIEKKKEGTPIIPKVDYKKGEKYSREYQTKLLAKILLKEIEKNDK